MENMDPAKQGTKRKKKAIHKKHENDKEQGSGARTTEKYSVDSIITKAEECINCFKYEVAQKFCQRALEMEPDNLRALETTASLLLEVGEVENAKQFLHRAVSVKPDEGHSKYLSLAQLLEGKEAVECYMKGIQIMIEDREKQSQEELATACGKGAVSPLRELSTAYCSVAELYMTDCCFEEDAEQLCRENIEKAVKADETNPEAYQSMANFLLVKEEKEEAKVQVQKSLSLWLPQYQAVREGKEEAKDTDPVDSCLLNYETRMNAAKILIELEEWEDAVQVLEGLVEEDDEVVETWYLLGWLNYLQGHGYRRNARYYLNMAIKMNSKAACRDDELIKHIEELLTELGTGEDSDERNGTEEDIENCETESSADEMDET